MKRFVIMIAGCCAVALAASSLLAQSESARVQVRDVADGEAKLADRDDDHADAKKSGTKEAETNKPTDAAEKEREPLRARVIRRFQEAAERVAEPETRRPDALTQEVWGDFPQSEYWIGVQIAPVAPEIRKHMSVKHGVLVVHVYPDSPAIKAHLKADDILLQAGNAKIETGPDLVKAVDAAKETELSLVVLRDGEEKKLSVTPVKREDGQQVEPRFETRPLPRLEKLQEAQRQFEKGLEALRAETQQDGAIDFMIVRPQAFMFHNRQAKFPDDLTVQVTKQGDKPAQVNVKKGDKTWDTTADKLDTLPSDVRPHVEQLLGAGQGIVTFDAPGGSLNTAHFQMRLPAPYPSPAAPVRVPTFVKPAVPAVPGVPATAAQRVVTGYGAASSTPDAKLDQILKKLDALTTPDLQEMKRELKRLREEVEELRKKNADM